MTVNKLSPEDIADFPLSGRPFLHEQGQSVCRGFVVDFQIEDGSWTVTVRDVEYLDKLTGQWHREVDRDEYGDTLSNHASFEEDTEDNMICLTGYGIVIYVAPACDSPWQMVEWPELDGYEGGVMDTSDKKRAGRKRR